MIKIGELLLRREKTDASVRRLHREKEQLDEIRKSLQRSTRRAIECATDGAALFK
jgi:hypothetical protein